MCFQQMCNCPISTHFSHFRCSLNYSFHQLSINYSQYFQLFNINFHQTVIIIIVKQLQQKNMEKSLYSKGQSTLKNVLGKWKVSKNSQPQSYTLQIYENGLLETTQDLSFSQAIYFDFDLKYSFTCDPVSVTFQRGQEVTYRLSHKYDLENWRRILKLKINQKGFHEQFKPIKKIGKGNFASVYLAQKIEDGVFYAVKAFSKEIVYSENNGKQSLKKQIEVMRCLSHPNTMKLHQIFQSENSLYIVFQLLSGGQLYDKIKAKYKFKSNQIKCIMLGILNGLKEMHSKGIMHRDLKPENLLLRKQGDYDCVIADFGLAEFTDIENYLFVRCGTPGYVAPEVINIRDMKVKYSPVCDLYSLGLIFHVLLFGKSAFSGSTFNEVLAQNRAANVDLNKVDFRNIEPEAFKLLSGLLKKDPKERLTAHQALQHAYFKIQNTETIETIESEMIWSNEERTPDSPLLTTANQRRRLDRSIKKDSCLNFQMAKQNVMTGKTEAVESLIRNKISIQIVSGETKKAKISQFCDQN